MKDSLIKAYVLVRAGINQGTTPARPEGRETRDGQRTKRTRGQEDREREEEKRERGEGREGEPNVLVRPRVGRRDRTAFCLPQERDEGTRAPHPPALGMRHTLPDEERTL
ncbi:hypothetical protein E2C01_092216 [Portunus trituberculatus]|uniref:Uncharacterized protein n=1 Tax=Portunus trituberculatus TaxID=210409 RepID=A0A5B7JX64_PORTR|nr:hypothetical protein [Portunus trituberculatus]